MDCLFPCPPPPLARLHHALLFSLYLILLLLVLVCDVTGYTLSKTTSAPPDEVLAGDSTLCTSSFGFDVFAFFFIIVFAIDSFWKRSGDGITPQNRLVFSVWFFIFGIISISLASACQSKSIPDTGTISTLNMLGSLSVLCCAFITAFIEPNRYDAPVLPEERHLTAGDTHVGIVDV